MNTPLEYQIALALLPKVGAITARKLVAYMGSVNAIFESTDKQLKACKEVGKALINATITNRKEALNRAKNELKFIEKHAIQCYFYLDKNYPKRLKQCSDAPVIMYQKGDINLNETKIISIVGTRNATEYGRSCTLDLVNDLAKSGIKVLVVSGLAYGIDVAAHKASMKANLPTVGVLGHGLDKMYPASHAAIAREMLQNNGALLTDFASGSSIDPGNFLRRNRIVAGMADCTIVVESANKGGALVTADIATSYNRDVFAFPGRSSDQYSQGCNLLIKQNKAALIQNAKDLMHFMDWEANAQPVQQPLMFDLSDDEELILKILTGSDIATTDIIAKNCGKNVQEVNTILLNLEFKNIVKSLPGNRFKLVAHIQIS